MNCKVSIQDMVSSFGQVGEHFTRLVCGKFLDLLRNRWITSATGGSVQHRWYPHSKVAPPWHHQPWIKGTRLPLRR
jgi:hypothetical protein